MSSVSIMSSFFVAEFALLSNVVVNVFNKLVTAVTAVSAAALPASPAELENFQVAAAEKFVDGGAAGGVPVHYRHSADAGRQRHHYPHCLGIRR